MTSPKHPAFGSSHHAGMTIREYFAGLAMQAIVSRGHAYNVVKNSDHPPNVATAAVEYADALIEALNMEPKS